MLQKNDHPTPSTLGQARSFVVALAVAGALSGVAVGQMGPTVVSVVPAQKRSVPSTLRLVGTVRPYTRSLIASEVSGLVEELPVNEGDWLDKGAKICQLRDTTRRLAYAEAEAVRKQLEAELAELEAGTRREEIARAKAVMEEARAVWQKWERELERVNHLRGQSAASPKEYNDTVSDAAAARERLAQMTASYDLAVAGPRREVIARARAAVEAAHVAAARLKYDLDQTVIRTPYAGYVTRKETEVGQWLISGGSVVEFMNLERVRVRIDVPESAVSACRVGDAVSVEIDALGKTFRGTIENIIPQADERARTFPVDVVVDNASRELKGGMFVRARVPAAPTVESVVVPRDAILQRQGSFFVVAVGPSPVEAGVVAMPVPVLLGVEVGDWVAIQSPMVQPGVPVAVKGHDRIYGPQPVQAVPMEVAASQPAAASQPSASSDVREP